MPHLMPSTAARASFADVRETCPVVDAVLATLAERYDIRPEDVARAGDEIKRRATVPLREALTAAHAARLQAEQQRDELRRQIEDLRAMLPDAEAVAA